MARTGFDFFQIYTNRYQDKRVKRLKNKYSGNGMAVYDYILNEIYRVHGYYLDWDEDFCFDVSDYFNIPEKDVSEMVLYCMEIGLFNKGIYERTGKLSSNSIQTFYTEMCRRSKRNPPVFPEEMLISPEEIAKPPEEVPVSPEVSTHNIREDSIIENTLDTNVSPNPDGLLLQVPDEKKEILKRYSSIPKTKSAIINFIKVEAVKKHLVIEPYADLWNLFATEYGKATLQLLTDKRKTKLRKRLSEKPFDFVAILTKAKDSEFCMRSKFFNFDWIVLNDENYIKVLEGNYDNEKQDIPKEETAFDRALKNMKPNPTVGQA